MGDPPGNTCRVPYTMGLAERLARGICSQEKVQGVAAWLWLTCRQLNIMSGVPAADAGHYDDEPTPCQELALQDLAERVQFFLDTPKINWLRGAGTACWIYSAYLASCKFRDVSKGNLMSSLFRTRRPAAL